MAKLPANLVMSAKVASALERGGPVVALESTVLTHGLPYPQNLAIFRALEEILSSEGVTPATILVLDGIAHIGLEESEVEALIPKLKADNQFHKLGMRDLSMAFLKSWSGGTTVSATMQLAALGGIRVFATGGIGGVHQGWNKTLDISSDLSALARIPVAVVSAGCKAILDIPATLECLEALAIPVLGWQTDRFPQFYTRESDHIIDRIDAPEEFSAYWNLHQALGGKGILVANPIPAEHSLPAEQMNSLVQAALVSAKVQGIAGKALTPFLLDFLAQHSNGGSVEANLALLKNNARLAAKLATALTGKEG